MNYKIPDSFMDKSVEGAIERVLQKNTQQVSPQSAQVTPAQNITSPQDYIILPSHKHGSYSYPDLLVAMNRLSSNSAVEKAAQSLGFKAENTSMSSSKKHAYDYIGNINWEQALKLNLSMGNLTLNPRQFVDFLNLLKSGKAHNGKGDKIDSKQLETILNEITEVRDPWRSEWLDADFKMINDVLHINYGHELVNGILKPKYSEPADCLMDDKTPGIDFDDWLKNANNHGLPKQNIKSGNLYYWAPDKDNNSVAGFFADSDWAVLDCIRDPVGSDSSLGVRAAREK